MAEFLLRGLLMMCCFLLAQSLLCNFCKGVSGPPHCYASETCGSNEVCFTERVQGNEGRPFYNSGCTKKETCTNGVPCKGLRECVSYCTTNKCNTKSCLESATGNVKKRSCREFKWAGYPSGVYTLDLRDGLPPFQVYCDMETAGGGWTVFQRRKDGSVDFYRGWKDYKKGFGDLRGEFWLGNDLLHRLTKAGLTTLRVDLGDWKGNTKYAQYSSFQVGPANRNYRLSVHKYRGTAGNSLGAHNEMAFTTKDRDNDLHQYENCAEFAKGAWWYRHCYQSSLNGRYTKQNIFTNEGIHWKGWREGVLRSLKSSEMKLREP